MRILTTSLLFAALSSQPILACCGVGPDGESIKFGSQQNIVIYNSKTQTEYFIRNARFQSGAHDIGFIAPTPTQPEITKTDRAIFSFINSKNPILRDSKGTEAVAAAAGGVEVVDIVEVAGYKATILKATDANALTNYLKEHNYATTPALTNWVNFYINKGWYLTAFQVINKEEMLETGVLCMKFKTDKPFNPYYVPANNIKVPAGLSLTFISDQYMEPTIGDSKPYNRQKWQAKLKSDDLERIAGYVGVTPNEIPSTAFLTQYHDGKFPIAQSDDIYFTPRSPAKNFAALFGPEKLGGDANAKAASFLTAFSFILTFVVFKIRKHSGTSNLVN